MEERGEGKKKSLADSLETAPELSEVSREFVNPGGRERAEIFPGVDFVVR